MQEECIVCKEHLIYLKQDEWMVNYVIKRIERDQMPERALCL